MYPGAPPPVTFGAHIGPQVSKNMLPMDQYQSNDTRSRETLEERRQPYMPAATTTYQMSGLQPSGSSEQYQNSAYFPLKRIETQPVQSVQPVQPSVQPATVTGVNVPAVPVATTNYLASSQPASMALTQQEPVATSFPSRTGGYVLLPAPTWTATHMIPGPVQPSTPSPPVPVIVPPSTAVTTARDVMQVTYPQPPVTPPDCSHLLNAGHSSQQTSMTAFQSGGGFSYPQPTPLSSPESQILSETQSDPLDNQMCDMGLHRLQYMRQTLQSNNLRHSLKFREPRPKQVRCACSDNACVSGRSNRTHSATRSHYSCKTATQILMTWIEEHPDNPYPNRDEKKRLAKRACMTVKQLGDWFGNARRRRKRLVQDELHMAKRAREMQLAAVGAS